MLYLFLGYVITQFYAIAEVFSRTDIAPSAMFFALIVFIIWSFLPVLGYALAKNFGALGHSNHTVLILAGVIIALLENGLSYFNFLSDKQHDIGTAIVFTLFFAFAYLPFKRTELASLK